MSNVTITPKTFGPYRAIGLSYKVSGGQPDFQGLWQRFMQMAQGLVSKSVYCFGICRCIPGATDGSWEYIAAGQVSDDAKVPDGLTEVRIAGGEYATTEVQGLSSIGQAWDAMRNAAGSIPGAKAYCGPDGCDCANHPSFELYSPDFEQTQRVGIYVPFRRT
jgi:predicted transcriptional regulator YdeE